MLQHILAGHSEIHTLPEPWFMLLMVYARKEGGMSAEYNAGFATLALNKFLQRLPDGHALFESSCRAFALDLYGSALEGTRKTRFLDKTPRYYFIIEELARIFPEAKFIFLLRNPIAVLASILDYNFRGDWVRMVSQVDRRHDLLTAPARIVEGIDRLGHRCAVVKYEELVSDATHEVEKVCEKIGVSFEPGMLKYSEFTKFTNTTFVDTKSVYQHETAVTDYVDAWKRTLDTSSKVSLAIAYLETLGKSVMDDFGEDLDSRLAELHELLGQQRRDKNMLSTEVLTRMLLGDTSRLSRREKLLVEREQSKKSPTIGRKWREWLKTLLDGRGK
jgi:hypothetical protein